MLHEAIPRTLRDSVRERSWPSCVGSSYCKAYGISKLPRIIGSGRYAWGVAPAQELEFRRFPREALIVDGGRGKHSRVPPTIVRHPFPEAWRVLLISRPKRFWAAWDFRIRMLFRPCRGSLINVLVFCPARC